MAEQSPADAVWRQGDAPESFAVHVGDPIMSCESLVEKCVVCIEEIENAAILSNNAFKEELGLLLERLAQVVIEVEQ